MKFMELTKKDLCEIKLYKETKCCSKKFISKEQRYKFTVLCQNFVFKNNETYFLNSKDLHLQFFRIDEKEQMHDYIFNLHNSCHFGRDRLYDFAKKLVYGIKKELIVSIVKKCVYCQSKRFMATKPKITPIISKAPRERYIADLVNLRAYSERNDNNSWMLVMVDSLSKFVMVRVTKTNMAREISSVFKELFYTYKPPIILHTDNGKEFKNSSVSEPYKELE